MGKNTRKPLKDTISDCLKTYKIQDGGVFTCDCCYFVRCDLYDYRL